MTGKFLGKFHTFKFRDPFLYINNFFDNKNLSNKIDVTFFENTVTVKTKDSKTNESILMQIPLKGNNELLKLLLSQTLFKDLVILENSLPRIIIEHTSANPISSLHLGRFRCSVIGDTLNRFLRSCGINSSTTFFVNDITLNVRVHMQMHFEICVFYY